MYGAGAALLDIVASERLQVARPGDPDPNAPLLAELSSSNTIMQVGTHLLLAFDAGGGRVGGMEKARGRAAQATAMMRWAGGRGSK